MMEEIETRGYSSTYLDAMYSLDQKCFSPAFRFDRASMQAFAEEPGAIVRIAFAENGEIAGFLIVHVEPAEGKQRAYIVTLDVAEEYRRRGLAQGLLSQAEESAQAVGAQRMELHVFTENQGAIQFYESSGYRRIEVKRRFYGKAGLDAFVYRKELWGSGNL